MKIEDYFYKSHSFSTSPLNVNANRSFSPEFEITFPKTDTQLQYEIVSTLTRFSQNTLFKDDHGEWTGKQAHEWMKKVKIQLTETTEIHSRIAVCLPNSNLFALTILAVISAQRIPVILNISEVTKKIQMWHEFGKTDWIITNTELENQLRQYYQNIIILDQFGNVDTRINSTVPALLHHSLVDPHLKILNSKSRNPVALILYTSGSTGKPKEVLVPEKGILKTIHFLIDHFSLNEKSISQIVLPICHSMALNTQFLPTFFAGGLCRFYNNSESLNKLFRSSLSEKVTFVSLIGELIRTCWDEKRTKKLEPCYSVTQMQIAGGLITPQHLEMSKELFPHAKIHKGYGMTEAIRVTMIDHLDPRFNTASVGKPLPFLEIEIRDELGQILPPEQMGQIFIKGDSVMVNLDQPFLPSGDIGVMDQQGYLTVYGREDSLFKVNGKRISGFEIEKAVYRSSEVFRQSKCLSIYDERCAGTKIILFIELDPMEILNSQNLEKWQFALWNNLRTLDYYPREIILMENFPLTSNGKLDLMALKNMGESKFKKLIKQSLPFNLKFFLVSDSI